MKKLLFYAGFTALFAIFSCGGQDQQTNVTDDELMAENDKDSVYSCKAFTLDDTMKIRGTQYRYVCTFAPDTSLAKVTTSYGYTYYDNVVDMNLYRGTECIFTHHFTKNSFASKMSEELLHTSALAGFNLNFTQQDASRFHFMFFVGDCDDSSVGKTFAVDIAVDGAMTITEIEVQEENQDSFAETQEG